MIADNKTFCIYPWLHLNTWPDGKVFQCCLTGWRNHIGNLEENTLEEIWNNDYMKDLRSHMLQGKKHWSCTKCYEQEENGIRSSRQSANENFSHHIEECFVNTDADGFNKDFKLLYWDFRFSNVCNFKCRMCGSFLSSKWYDEEIKNGGSLVKEKIVHVKNHIQKDDSIERYLEKFIKDVEEVYFAGGEPLLMDEHYYILQRLIEVGNTKCKIRYNTNLSKLDYKTFNCLEFWKKFDNVQIFASIDDFGLRAEYARSGTVWETVENNLKKLITDAKNVNLQTSSTINIFNIMYIPQIVDELIRIGVKPWHIAMNNVLTYPLEYHINILPDELKKEVELNLNNHLNTLEKQNLKQYFVDKYKSVIMFMKDNPDNVDKIRQNFKKRINRLDKIRNETFQDTFPELRNWYNEI